MLLDLKIRRASLLVERRMNRYLRKADIDIVELGVLIAASEKLQSQVDIATALDIHPNSISQICGRLLRMEYIERRHDPEDRRRLLVSLTPLGHSLVKKTKQAVADLEGLIFYPLSDEQIEQLDALVTKLGTPHPVSG